MEVQQQQPQPGQQQTSASIRLKLCLYGGNMGVAYHSFDRSCSLKELESLMRDTFNVDPDIETKLWIYNSVYYHFKPGEQQEENSAPKDAATDSDNAAAAAATATTNNGTLTSNHQQASNDSRDVTTMHTVLQSRCNNNGASGKENSPNNKGEPDTTMVNNNGVQPPPSPRASPNAGENNDNSLASGTKSPSLTNRLNSANSTSNKQPIALPDVSTSNKQPDTDSVNAPAFATLVDKFIAASGVVPTTKPQSASTTLSDISVKEDTIVTLEIMNTDGTWPSDRPKLSMNNVTTRSSKTQPGLCGLVNMGNTCYMNAALQCLSNTPPLTNYILADKFVDDINTSNPLGMNGQIARAYAELVKVMWSDNNTVLPRDFKSAVGRFAPQFTGFSQQDCQELMAFLLDGLHEDLNRIKNKPYIETNVDIERRPDEVVAKESWENYKKRNDSIVVDTFHGLLKSTLHCPECNLVSVTFDPFCYLSLPLPAKREKQVNLIFSPAPGRIDLNKISAALNVLSPEEIKIIQEYGGKISSFDGSVEEHAGYASSSNRPMSCKLQVPKSGPVNEICDYVARVINQERDQEKQVKPDNLVVAELAIGRISKIYEPSEHYNQISDDIVVIEKASNYVLPLYSKEQKDVSNSMYGMSKLLFLHVPDLKYETLYKSIITSLSNLTTTSEEDVRSWCKLSPPEELDDKMECDDEESGENTDHELKDVEDGDVVVETDRVKTNGKSVRKLPNAAFDLTTVNSFGTHSFETLGPNRRDCVYSSKLYLCATFSTGITSSPQFEHNRAQKSEPVDTFTPKGLPKPNLQLNDCIGQFTNAEKLGADDPWFCPKCKKAQQATKKFDIWSLPKILIIHLKRFSFSRSWRDKIDTFVEFPVEGLEMSSYVHNPEQKEQKRLTYNLIGVANHFGGLGGGHYTAYAKNAPQNAWYTFDDALVSPTSAGSVVTRSAYVLFYQLQEDGMP